MFMLRVHMRSLDMPSTVCHIRPYSPAKRSSQLMMPLVLKISICDVGFCLFSLVHCAFVVRRPMGVN